MCEVMRSNFDVLYPQIKRDIEDCDFVCIDSEFTGLKLSEDCKPSLFDSGEDRYEKLKQSVKNFTLSQIGISAFISSKEIKNKYEAHTYNFYLHQASFGPIDPKYLSQVSSLEFLCKHNFDFNKFVYEGISFMTYEQEAKLREYLEKEDLFGGLERDVDERELQDCCSEVAQWILTAKEYDTMTLNISHLEYVLVTELRQRFPQIWAEDDNGTVTVRCLNPTERVRLENETRQEEEERIINRMMGFTRVFRTLTTCKKPIIGHNNFMDLIFMYEKFHNPLPDKYSKFKADLNEMFPTILDTKNIVASLRKAYEDKGFFAKTSLGELYWRMDGEQAKFHVLYTPSISHAADFTRYKDLHCPHEAGYDAYMCGYVFLRVIHLVAGEGIRSTQMRTFDFSEYLAAARPFINHVNLIRAAVAIMKVDGKDPLSDRPQWIFVKSKNVTHKLRASQLARLFSPYGSVDIQVQGPWQAVVAVANFGSARDILRAFKHDKTFYVTKYIRWKHSPVLNALMWTALVASGTVCVWTLISGIKSRSS